MSERPRVRMPPPLPIPYLSIYLSIYLQLLGSEGEAVGGGRISAGDGRVHRRGEGEVAEGAHSGTVCVCVSVFFKLHVTAQSGPVILVILCHSR